MLLHVSWKGASRFNEGRGRCFPDEGDFNFKWGATHAPPPPLWETLYKLLVFLNWVPFIQIYPLNACKLDWENLFDFYAESMALIINTLNNVTSIFNDSRLYIIQRYIVHYYLVTWDSMSLLKGPVLI